MSDIRLKKITVDSNSLTIPLTIQQGNVYISSTTNSADPFQGALTVSSIGVSSTADTTSSSSGGAMSIAGGLSVMKSINVGSDINIDGISGKLKVSGLSINRLFFLESVQIAVSSLKRFLVSCKFRICSSSLVGYLLIILYNCLICRFK